MDLQLSGKTALVTGASGGLGRAIAVELASEGVQLCLAARRQPLLEELAREVTAKGAPPPLVAPVDLTVKDAPAQLAQRALDSMGHIDILINAAGAGSGTGWMDAPDEKWLASLTVNYTQIRRLTLAVVPHMIQQRWGRIINITGKAEPAVMNAGIPAKLAVNAFAKGLSREVGRYGITVNTIPPGKVLSEAVQKRYSEQYKKDFADGEIPVGRFGEPQEVAFLAVCLCSPRASFINGSILHVDGGQHRFAFS